MVFGIIGHIQGMLMIVQQVRFTAPVTGFYQFSFNCYLVRATLGVANHTFCYKKWLKSEWSVFCYKNWGWVVKLRHMVPTSFCVPLYLTAGDVVTCIMVVTHGQGW